MSFSSRIFENSNEWTEAKFFLRFLFTIFTCDQQCHKHQKAMMKSDSSFFNNRIKHEETQPVTELIRRLPVRQLPLHSNWFCLCDFRDGLVHLVNSTSFLRLVNFIIFFLSLQDPPYRKESVSLELRCYLAGIDHIVLNGFYCKV